MIFRSMLFCSLILFLCSAAKAQDYDIQRYDINVQLQPAANTAQVQAKLTVINVTTQNRTGQFVNLKINKNATVASARVDGADAQFRQKNDDRLNTVANLTIDLPKSLQPKASAQLQINYSLEFKEGSPLAAIMPGETLLLPESFWIPVVHTPFTGYGLDAAPAAITVAVENERAASDGAARSSASPYSFEQTVPSLPILLSGDYDAPFEIKTSSVAFEFVCPRGLSQSGRKQAEAIAKEGGQIIDFYSKLLSFGPPERIRIITSSRISSYASGTTLVLSEDLFRRDSIDLETAEFMARSLLRYKLGGEYTPRGRGWHLLHDMLPAYLAGLYFEQQYGQKTGREFFARRVRAYAPIAASKTDGPLIFASPLDNTYTTSVINKGSMMMRIIETRIGRDKLIGIIKERLNGSNKTLSFDDFRSAITAANKSLTLFFDQWFDKICEPDFIIGIPFQAEGGWKCAMRNLGEGEAVIQVAAVTEKGERLVEPVQLPSQGRAEVFFKTAEKIASVEVDPEKLYPQTSYDNDTRPPYLSPFTLFKNANADFSKREYGQAEAKLREALNREPEDAVSRTLLVRTLAGQNKFDEAKKEIEIIRKFPLLPIYSITWINYTLGEIALASKQNDAADYFGKAVAASKEAVAARQKRLEAEKASGKTPAVDESVRAFIGKLDKAIKDATNQALDPLVIRANLNKFVRGIVVNKPDSWSTQIIHVEQLTADKLSLDVAISAVSGDKQEQRGTAVYILRRSPSGWVLNDIELFNVQ